MTARRAFIGSCLLSYFLGAAVHAHSVEKRARKRAREMV